MEIKETLNKPYTEEERIDFIVENNHKKGYTIEETEESLIAWGTDSADLFEQAKADKIAENDSLRDIALLSGVTYNNVLFDSDTDQKANLLGAVLSMPDDKTIIWYGMDNQGLLCTKADLYAIGSLITELHSYCWNMNAYIKEQINNAQTMAELDEIEISYDRPNT